MGHTVCMNVSSKNLVNQHKELVCIQKNDILSSTVN